MRRKLADNWKRIEQRVHDACSRFDRKPSDVTVVAITKYATLDLVRTLVDLGITDLGENRVQEFTKRAAAINEWLRRRSSDDSTIRPRWHMVGHLQRNKVKAILPWVDMVHSVDSLRLAEEIDAQAAKLDRITPVLLQVNVTEQTSQHGVAVAAITHLVEQVASLNHVDVRGLMAIGPITDNADRIRYVFGRVRELFDEIVVQELCGPNFKDLSLGMSGDFEHAIEVGATYVRIGSALFDGIEIAKESLSAG